MKHTREIHPTRLPARSVHNLEHARGQQITAIDGVVWLTQVNDPRDIILTKGSSYVVERNGLTVLFALRDAAITVGPPGHITALEVDGTTLRHVAA